MSMVVYVNDVLLADRIGIYTGDDMARLVPMQKLHISACRRFAFGYCGSKLMQSQLEELELYLLSVLTMSRVDKIPYDLGPDDRRGSNVSHAVLGKQKCIVMTSDAVYEHSRQYSGSFVRLETSDVILEGTYSDGFYTALRIKQMRAGNILFTEKEVVDVAFSYIDYVSGQANPTIDSICRHDLLQFNVDDVVTTTAEEN
jgi:hypothetical protein